MPLSGPLLSPSGAWNFEMPRGLPLQLCLPCPMAAVGRAVTWACWSCHSNTLLLLLLYSCVCTSWRAMSLLQSFLLEVIATSMSKSFLLLFLFVLPWKSLKSLESIACHQLQIMQRHFYVLKLVSSLSLYFLRCTEYQFCFTIRDLLVKSLDKVLFRSRHWK